MKTKKTPENLPGINQSLSERRRIPMALVSTIVIMLFALSGKAGNILVNPGFETTIFTSGGWSQHASETWSMSSAGAADPTAIKLVHSGANGLWMQGLYGNGQPIPQTSYAAQDLACLPGNTYTADAWYSTYAMCTKHIGGDDGSLNAAPINGGGSSFYTADGSGNEDGWVEVQFYNSGNVLLADYKSAIVTPAFIGTAVDTEPTTNAIPDCVYTPGTANDALVTNGLGNIYLGWVDMPVTNQYDVTTVGPNIDPVVAGGVTNTLAPGQLITAPPGAVKVEFRINLYQAAYEAGAPFWDDATLNQVGGPSASVIGNISPDGTKFFNGTNTSFTFNITSAASGGAPFPTNATGSVGVIVNGQNETGSLQFSGPSTNLSVTLPGLSSNSLYTISVSTTNSVGLTSSKTITFDTFPASVFIVSAEDYDYTNGQFFENPTPTPGTTPAANSYSGTGGTLGVDVSTYGATGILPGGASQLIRTDGFTAMQKADDVQLPLYAAQNNVNVYNVQIAYNNPGNWLNYTRNYPTGNYLVYLRYNNPTAGTIESLNLLTSGYGTSSQTVTNLGEFIGAATGAGYAWVPLTDAFGNKIIVNLPAAENSPAGNNTTLQLFSGNGAGAGGIANFVDFIFVPAGTAFPPVINNLNPNNINPPANGNIFLNVTDITYSVSSAFSTVASSSIHTVVNGVDISSSATITGSNTDWSVSVPCPQNQLINLVIQATDATGATNSISESFDTFTQSNLMIETVDFDFNGGQFIDNPLPTAGLVLAANSYWDGGPTTTNAAVQNIDYNGFSDGGAEAWNYRPLDTHVGEEITADFLRSKFNTVNGIAQDYAMGYWNGGFWENYTRTIPASSYNVYARLAGGAGPFSGTTLSVVTSGRGTTSQTTQLLGSFADANPAGWETWHWVPMRDVNGNLVTATLGGVKTLRLTSGNNLNAHFFMLVPTGAPIMTALISSPNVQLSFVSEPGHTYTVLYNTTLTGGTWQTLSAGIAGDGTVKTVNDTVTGRTRFYKVQMQ